MPNSAAARATPANDSTAKAEILAAFQRISNAFAEGDGETVKSMTTADHQSVSHYPAPQREIWKRVAAGEFEGYEHRPVSEIEIIELAPGIAVQRHLAATQGTCQGTPMPARIAVVIVWEKRGSKWFQRHFQLTPMPQA